MNTCPDPSEPTTPVPSHGPEEAGDPAADGERHRRPHARGRQRRDGGRVHEGTSARPLIPPLDRVDDDRAVACGPAEDRIARVAQNDESRRFGVGCADRVVGREALGDLEFRPHGPRQIGQLIGKLVGECLVAVGHRNRGPTTFLDVQPRLHRERSRSTGRVGRARASGRGRTRPSSGRATSGTAPGARSSATCARRSSASPRRAAMRMSSSSMPRRSRADRAGGSDSRRWRRTGRPSRGVTLA